MGLVGGIVLIVLGALCVPSLIAQKSPNAKELLDKIVPYQGIAGAVICIWGIWGIISAILTLGWLGSWPLWWATRLAGNVFSAAGGAILGWGLLQKNIVSRAPANAQAKMEESYMKLVALQPKIGIICMFIGLWVIVYELVLQKILLI